MYHGSYARVIFRVLYVWSERLDVDTASLFVHMYGGYNLYFAVQAAYEPGKGVGDMSEVLAMLLDWATKEGRDLRVFTFDFNKFFDRYSICGSNGSCDALYQLLRL